MRLCAGGAVRGASALGASCRTDPFQLQLTTLNKTVNCPLARALRRHLRAKGILEVPAPLGFDAQGREILTFIPGLVGNDPLPEYLRAGQATPEMRRECVEALEETWAAWAIDLRALPAWGRSAFGARVRVAAAPTPELLQGDQEALF